MVSRAARRYAKALLNSAIELDILDQVTEDVRFILSTLSDSKDLKILLKSPVIKQDDKKKILSSVFSEHITKVTMSLLHLLSEKGRENLVYDICRDFIQLYNQHMGIIQVDVSTAFKLDNDQIELLKDKLVQSTGKKVEMDIHLRPDLIGGLVVKIDDTVIDGSIKHKIRKLKNQFAVNSAV